ncbi:hypothetical protein COLO4_25050 [Corchorus olitorius]|uniref:Uncharacterized protein n=1 Tax=Corchorus olitorius TaxID=93759 RepID=A0A1R3I4Y0_9ROSI|nr:hypothetical protein COLO4_25050 [Corchorus olitorius]
MKPLHQKIKSDPKTRTIAGERHPTMTCKKLGKTP